MEYQPCHRYEILVANLTFLEKIDRFHGPVPDIMTSMNVLESVGPDFAAVQAYQVQGTLSVNMFLHLCKFTPHPREKRNTGPRLTNLKLTVETIRCYSYGIVKTIKCKLSTPQDKLEIPTEHLWKAVHGGRFYHWLRLLSLYRFASGIDHVSTRK